MKLAISKILELANALQSIEGEPSGNGHAKLRLSVRGSFRFARGRAQIFDAITAARKTIEDRVQAVDDASREEVRKSATDELLKEEVDLAIEPVPISMIESLPETPQLMNALGVLGGVLFVEDEKT